ncbi:MAG: tetratricopeptide repeat protein [Oligoflexales bacterium]
MTVGSTINIPNDAAIVIVADDKSKCLVLRKQLQGLGLSNIYEFTSGAECLLHLQKRETSLLYLLGNPVDMDLFTFVRASRSGPTFAVNPVFLLAPPDSIFSPDERSFLADYQVVLIKSTLTDQKKISATLKDVFVSKNDPSSVETRAELAKTYLKDGMLREAKKIFEELLAESMNNIVARVGLVRASADAPEEQFRQLETLLSQDPKNYNFKFELIENCIKSGRHDHAHKLLENIIKELTGNKEVFWLNELGIVCVGLKLFQFCMKIAARLARLAAPHQAWLSDMLLSRTHLASGNLEEAKKHLKKTEKLISSKHSEIENLRAIIARRSGDYSTAIQSYLEAFSLAPEDHRIPYNIGLCYEHLGSREEATRYFKLALTMSPGFVKAEEHLRKHSPST